VTRFEDATTEYHLFCRASKLGALPFELVFKAQFGGEKNNRFLFGGSHEGPEMYKSTIHPDHAFSAISSVGQTTTWCRWGVDPSIPENDEDGTTSISEWLPQISLDNKYHMC